MATSSSKAGPVVAIGLVLALLFSGILGLVIISGSISGGGGGVATVVVAYTRTVCTPSGSITTLTSGQAGEALTIFGISTEMSGGLQGDSHGTHTVALIATMTAYTESGLHDYGPMSGNTGSIGLFQQRPTQGWGSVAQLETPKFATAAFVTHLLALTPHWTTLTPWAAAQAVQRSGTSKGHNYRKNLAEAHSIVNNEIHLGNTPTSPTKQCGAGTPSGKSTPATLPATYAIPTGTGPRHVKAIDFAIAQLGKPYVYASGSPHPATYPHWTCSSLVASAWASAGVPLTAYTGAMMTEGSPIPPTTLMAGDMVLVPGSDPPGPGIAGHVGIYLGSGMVLSAVDQQTGIRVQSWTTFVSGGLDAVRNPTG